jgi:putative ABC transport system permease protein
MGSLLSDLRHSVRMLLKKPDFTLIAVLTLALGIGANTAIFSVINAVLLRPLPYPNESRLVVLQQTRADKPTDDRGVSYLNFNDWQAQSQSFESMAIVATDEATWTGEGEPVRVRGAVVSSDFFKTLGIATRLGRTFTASDDLPGADGGFNSVILTDSGWRNRFGGDPKIIGRKITVGEQAFTIVGVTPPGILPLQKEPIDYWATVAINGDAAKSGTANASRGYRAYLGVIARLKPGVTVAQARAEMETLNRRLQEKYQASNGKVGVAITPLRDLVVGDARSSLWLLFGIVGAVLLIACVNVANLLLARATTRQREIAIRSALGAGTRHIVQQLLSESLLLSLAGGLIGLLLSMWLIDVLMAMLPAEIPQITGLAPDWRVLLFTFSAAILTGLLCGLAPAFTALKTNLTDAIKEGGRNASASSFTTWLRNGLVVGQIAIALVLLAGAGLLVKSLIRLHQVKPGFETGNILTMQMVLSGDRYLDRQMKPERINAFMSELTDRVSRMPGVSNVSFAQCVPLTSVDNNTGFDIIERPSSKGEQPSAQLRFIGLNYFQILGIPELTGRDFTEHDNPQTPPVVIVNEAFAREHFKGEDPIGKRLKLGWGGDDPKEIVGVVSNVRHRALSDIPRPEMYVPQAQFANAGITLLVRSQLKPENLIAPVKKEIYTLDPQLPITDIKTLDEFRADSMAVPRFNAFLLGLFAGLALLLTAVGLFGVMSYSVTQRTNEIGIRLALGAQITDVLRLVIGQGMRLVMLGVLIGLAASMALTRLMANLLFEVSTTDPLTFAGVALLLIGVVLLACWIPARRATKVDPIIALRCE